MSNIHLQITAAAVAETIEIERERCAKLVEVMIKDVPWKDNLTARAGLMLAANVIRRGRHLTEAEKLANLKAALFEDGDEPVQPSSAKLEGQG